MTEYTVVEPGFEFIEPPTDNNYLEFLEICTRNCYKSEDKIGPGSAEKLLNKVVNDYGHMSVTEHANAVFKIAYPLDTDWEKVNRTVSLFKAPGITATRAYEGMKDKGVYIRGNLRAWKERLDQTRYTFGRYPYGCIVSEESSGIVARLKEKWPFFFDYELRRGEDYERGLELVRILDENPITNKDNLSPFLLKNLTTLTYRIIGDRTMSHQLVRHRMMSYSQESQRYCNYGKKGFQFVIPPSARSATNPKGDKDRGNYFADWAVTAYEHYLNILDNGVKPEDARGLLPGCTKTEVITTGTLAQWQHIFRHRADNPKAQWQIRGIMQGIKEHMYDLLPWLEKA